MKDETTTLPLLVCSHGLTFGCTELEYILRLCERPTPPVQSSAVASSPSSTSTLTAGVPATTLPAQPATTAACQLFPANPRRWYVLLCACNVYHAEFAPDHRGVKAHITPHRMRPPTWGGEGFRIGGLS